MVDRRERERDHEGDDDEEGESALEAEEEEERMEEEEDDVHHVLGFNKWLLAVQCTRTSLASLLSLLRITKLRHLFFLPVGPAFCAGVLFGSRRPPFVVLFLFVPLLADSLALFMYAGESDNWIPTIILSSLGLVLGFITLVYSSDGENRFWRLGRCLLGFSVAMIWIMAIGESSSYYQHFLSRSP